MVVAAFVFGTIIFSFSLFFLMLYVRSNNFMRANRSSLARQREQQLKLQAELQARMEREARQFEATRQALLRDAPPSGGGDPDRRDVEHAA
jgi:hypothetical protein